MPIIVEELKIETVAALDSYYTDIEGIIARREFDRYQRLISADAHREALDTLLPLAQDARGLGRVAQYLHDIVRSGHVDVYREKAPLLRERVDVYERGMRAMHEDAAPK